jgi:hypothetical protein
VGFEAALVVEPEETLQAPEMCSQDSKSRCLFGVAPAGFDRNLVNQQRGLEVAAFGSSSVSLGLETGISLETVVEALC